MDSPLLQVRILTNLASAEVKAGRLNAAEQHIARGLQIAAHDPSATEWRAYLWGVQAQAAAAEGDSARAGRLLDRVFAGVDLKKSDLVYRDFHETAFHVYDKLGQDQRALQHLE